MQIECKHPASQHSEVSVSVKIPLAANCSSAEVHNTTNLLLKYELPCGLYVDSYELAERLSSVADTVLVDRDIVPCEEVCVGSCGSVMTFGIEIKQVQSRLKDGGILTCTEGTAELAVQIPIHKQYYVDSGISQYTPNGIRRTYLACPSVYIHTEQDANTNSFSPGVISKQYQNSYLGRRGNTDFSITEYIQASKYTLLYPAQCGCTVSFPFMKNNPATYSLVETATAFAYVLIALLLCWKLYTRSEKQKST